MPQTIERGPQYTKPGHREEYNLIRVSYMPDTRCVCYHFY